MTEMRRIVGLPVREIRIVTVQIARIDLVFQQDRELGSRFPYSWAVRRKLSHSLTLVCRNFQNAASKF